MAIIYCWKFELELANINLLTNFNFTHHIFYFSTLISGVFIFLIGKDTIKITIIETNSSHVSTGKYYRWLKIIFTVMKNSKFRRSSDVNRFILDVLCRLLLLLSKRFRWSKDEIQLRKLHSHLWNRSIH